MSVARKATHPISISKSAIAARMMALARSAFWRVMEMGAPRGRARNAARRLDAMKHLRRDAKQRQTLAAHAASNAVEK